MAYIRVDGLDIHYEVHGTGQPLLFIHDWNTSSVLFRKINLPAFAREYRVILLDLPGFGKSARAAALSFELFSRIIGSIADHLRLRDLDLMGFCLGAVIALDYAIRNPSRIRRLVLLEPIIEYPQLLSVLFLPGIGKPLLRFFSRTERGLTLFLRVMWGENRFFRKIFMHAVRKSSESVSRDYLELLYRYSRLDHYRRASSLSCETVIVTGDRSLALIRRCARRLSRCIPGARPVSLPDTRHFVLLEAPERVFLIVSGP